MRDGVWRIAPQAPDFSGLDSGEADYFFVLDLIDENFLGSMPYFFTL